MKKALLAVHREFALDTRNAHETHPHRKMSNPIPKATRCRRENGNASGQIANARPCNAASYPVVRCGVRHTRTDLRLPALRWPAGNRNPAGDAEIRRLISRNSGNARAASHDPQDRSGVWRYRELLPFDHGASIVTLFEGNTPLYDAPRCAKYCGLSALRLKHQGCNPTASFKDTGMTVAVTQAALLGARTVVCASTGNTAASLAAYAARAELQCAILLPQGQISPAKLAQSMDYGADRLRNRGKFRRLHAPDWRACR